MEIGGAAYVELQQERIARRRHLLELVLHGATHRERASNRSGTLQTRCHGSNPTPRQQQHTLPGGARARYADRRLNRAEQGEEIPSEPRVTPLTGAGTPRRERPDPTLGNCE